MFKYTRAETVETSDGKEIRLDIKISGFLGLFITGHWIRLKQYYGKRDKFYDTFLNYVQYLEIKNLAGKILDEVSRLSVHGDAFSKIDFSHEGLEYNIIVFKRKKKLFFPESCIATFSSETDYHILVENMKYILARAKEYNHKYFDKIKLAFENYVILKSETVIK